jgi:molecular chaperone GrpE
MEEDKRGPNEGAEEPAQGMVQGDHDDNQQDAEARIAELVSKLSAELEATKAENEELKDRSLRLIAEMENLRRRTERDKSEFAKYAISEFARDVVGVGDNIRRAIEAVPKEVVTTDPALGSLIEGIEVTERELLKVLEKFQVKRFDPLGEPFNPHLHDAMTKIDIPNVPADTVVQVIHAGYMIDERVLRPAAVIVAKGSVRPEPPASSNNQSGGDQVPPGAMKVPDDVVSSFSARETGQHKQSRADVQQTVLGREFQADQPPERRRQNPSGASAEERVAPLRRRAAGESPHNDQRPQNGQGGKQNGQGGNKASTLHKPVISNNE